jgi:hypothetical protein
MSRKMFVLVAGLLLLGLVLALSPVSAGKANGGLGGIISAVFV